MKHLIAAFLFAVTATASIAKELEVAGFENNVGGWTIITNRDEHCGNRNMHDGYAYAAGGNNLTQLCWLIRGERVLAVLETGEPLFWSVRSFQLLEYEPDIQAVTGALAKD